MIPLGKASLAFAAKGMRVFPCAETGKEPAGYDNLSTRPPIRTSSAAGGAREFNATGPIFGIWALDAAP